MILFELVGNEKHKAYENLSIDNLERQYDFLRSIINAAIELNRPMLSNEIIKALNSHAISCLHVSAGQFRPCPVRVGNHIPPEHYRVPELMNTFVNEVNRYWETSDPVSLATHVLWKVNYIHPFINGNGRTARALCYYVLCTASGGLLKGNTTLPEIIRQNREEYVALLRQADADFVAGKPDYLSGLYEYIVRMINIQIGEE